ncbi:hypothetical protein F5880DRAFT_1589164 [Lentinula raphanica]|nr:hypothetical protein F5880DRAFT_1589164 [Lentinula raphanica]
MCLFRLSTWHSLVASMLLLSMLVAAMAPVPTRPSSAAKMELSTSKFRAHKAPPVPPVDVSPTIPPWFSTVSDAVQDS